MIKLKLPESESPKAIAVPQVSSAAVSTPKSKLAIVPIGLSFAFGALLCFVLVREFGSDSNTKPIDDQKQVIDDKPTPPNAGLKDCLLLVVRDTKTTNLVPEYVATLQNDTFWRVTAPSIVKDVEFLEDDDETSKKLINVAGIPAPFVMLFNAKTRKMVWSIPLPKGNVSEIERKLK